MHQYSVLYSSVLCVLKQHVNHKQFIRALMFCLSNKIILTLYRDLWVERLLPWIRDTQDIK
jgi:hypothetical protein